MSIRVTSWIAWSLCLLCVALAVASPILALLNGRTLGEIFMALGGPPIATRATLTVSFSVVGALIASRRPENPIGWIFLAVGLFYGLLTAGEQYAIYVLLTNPGSLPLGAEASWLMQWIWAPGLGLILVFLPLLPRSLIRCGLITFERFVHGSCARGPRRGPRRSAARARRRPPGPGTRSTQGVI
jgi:hypothetical protein